MFYSKKDSDVINQISLDAKFGEGQENSNGGSCVFVLSGCYLRLNETYLSIIANSVDKCNQPAFISFYK